MRIRQELTIHSAPESVFRWIERPELACRWQPEVAEYETTEAVPGLVGTRFRELLRDSEGSIELHGRVTGYVPNAMMEFDLHGRGVQLRARYSLSPDGSGTRLRVDTDARLGGWLSFLVAPFARRPLKRQIRSELESLRRLCEAAG